MNTALSSYARQTLIEGLDKCTPDQQNLFRRMYGHTLPEDTDMATVVMQMPESKLDWAMNQVEATLAKNAKQISA